MYKELLDNMTGYISTITLCDAERHRSEGFHMLGKNDEDGIRYSFNIVNENRKISFEITLQYNSEKEIKGVIDTNNSPKEKKEKEQWIENEVKRIFNNEGIKV